jgi:hypothetical protein
MTPSPRETLDPLIKAIFDAMEAYMAANSLPSVNCTAAQSGAGISESLSATESDGDSFTFQFFTKGVMTTITPAAVSLGPSGTQQFTAIATNPDGSAVASAAFTWTLTSGPGTLDTAGLYTAPATIAQATNATIRATLTGGESWGQVIITVHP